MTARCPCCGQEVSAEKVIVDLDMGSAWYRGREATMAHQGAEVLHVLVERWPRAVPLADIAHALWGYRSDEYPVQTIRVVVSQLRRAVRDLGLRVVLAGRGYALVVPEAQ